MASYFKTAQHFSNAVRKFIRENRDRFDGAKVMSSETYVDMAYSAGLGDDFFLALREDASILEEDQFFIWMQKTKVAGFALPKEIDLVTTNEFRECLKSLSKRPGCYTFWNDSDLPLYIGTSTDLASRICCSFSERFRHYRNTVFLRYVVTETASDASVCEAALIAKHKPALNGAGKFADELTIHIHLPQLSERIQCNIPGEKTLIRDGQFRVFSVPTESAENFCVESSELFSNKITNPFEE
jgi:hypothetical protein